MKLRPCWLSSNSKLSRHSSTKRFVPASSLLLSSVVFFPIPGTDTRARIHAYVRACVRANVPRVAFAMQNSPARRSLIMHSARWRCATIESPGRALHRVRSSAQIDFPRYIFATDNPSASSTSSTRFCGEEIWTMATARLFQKRIKEKTLNYRGIIVSLVAIFNTSLSPSLRSQELYVKFAETGTKEFQHSHRITGCKYTVADISK